MKNPDLSSTQQPNKVLVASKIFWQTSDVQKQPFADVLKNFAISRGKHLRKKETPTQVLLFCEYC